MRLFYSFILSLFLSNNTFYCAGATPPFVKEAQTARQEEKNAKKAEIIFFDVGQGHCTLVSIPGEPLLLVDAGSTGLRGLTDKEKDNFKNSQINKIQEKITSLLSDTDTKHTVNVIISHGDLDHYSWLKEIFPIGKTVTLNILCGGKKADYNPEFSTNFTNATFVEQNDLSSLKSQFPAFFSSDPKPCSILSAKNTGDKNTNSIVVRCEYGGKSVILTGDATKKTVDDIKTAESTILQMAHHGATSDNSNSTAWFKKVKSQYVVCSSGEREDYKHPDWQSLENLNQAMREDSTIKLNDNTTKAHVVRFHRQYEDYVKLEAMQPISSATTSALHPFMFFTSNYIFYITTLGIYNSTDAGDISFTWGAGDDVSVQVTTARGPEFSAKAGPNAIIETAEKMIVTSTENVSGFRFPTDKACLAIKLPKGFKAENILKPDTFKWSDIYELDASDVAFDSMYDPANFLTHMTKLRRFKLKANFVHANLSAITERFGTQGIQ
tara:strand:- start:1071 stop:2555 length:1485 start_codon:yes stop_codon:yes gene_type:complete